MLSYMQWGPHWETHSPTFTRLAVWCMGKNRVCFWITPYFLQEERGWGGKSEEKGKGGGLLRCYFWSPRWEWLPGSSSERPEACGPPVCVRGIRNGVHPGSFSPWLLTPQPVHRSVSAVALSSVGALFPPLLPIYLAISYLFFKTHLLRESPCFLLM